MDIELDDQPFDLDFHPCHSIVAVGLITGRLHLFHYDDALSDSQRLWTTLAHTESCRAVRFVDSGRSVLTASPDCSILATNVETGQPIARLDNAHGAAVNRLINLTETTIASGDDDGTIKVWDTRQNSCCNKFKAHEDYISDMEFVPDTMQLLGTSGDGRLSVCNLRKNKVHACSEFSEDELLSVVLMKHGKKVVCGSQEGVLLLYSWGYFNDCSDRFVGHPSSVDALLKLDEDTVLTGSSDGIIRVVSILPNKMIGVIGEHASYPIERLAFSYDRRVLGSASHDNILKLWDVKYLHEGDESGVAEKTVSNNENEQMDLDVDIEKEPRGSKRKRKSVKGQSLSQKQASDFFADI
uniref:WD repeat-containing protein 55 n=1 Tax=Araucaria cunninghamii TaxID=56994 RepID=A0A0D6R6E7_ARACU